MNKGIQEMRVRGTTTERESFKESEVRMRRESRSQKLGEQGKLERIYIYIIET